VIGVADVLNIIVFNEPDASRLNATVDSDGTIDMPYIGRVKAAGLTVREVGEELRRRLVPNYLVNPQISIDLEQIANKRVTVTGEVRAPSEYPFAGELSLLTALTKAGSITENAADEALVYHAGSSTGIPVNLQELMSGQLSNNMTLQDGDTVLVLKAEPVYVTGEVRTPSSYFLRHGMTVQQVIALAGGITDRGTTNGIKIQRRPAPGQKTGDVIKVKDFKAEIVKPGDPIVVPRRAF
jgi:polysaccharide export outer membrane protein